MLLRLQGKTEKIFPKNERSHPPTRKLFLTIVQMSLAPWGLGPLDPRWGLFFLFIYSKDSLKYFSPKGQSKSTQHLRKIVFSFKKDSPPPYNLLLPMKMSEKLGFGLNILYPAEQENCRGVEGNNEFSASKWGEERGREHLYFLMKFHGQSRASTHWDISVFRWFFKFIYLFI